MARIALMQDTLIEYMGYMQMSAVLKAEGHRVEVFFDDQLRTAKTEAAVKRFRPDIIGYSCLTPSRGWANDSAARLRATTGAVTIAGNVDCILSPEAYAGGSFDLICTGEGEYVLTELAAALDNGTGWSDILGTWHVADGVVTRHDKRDELVDMAELPIIDRSLYDKYAFFKKSPYLRVYAGRGCPFRCSFCSNTTMTDAFGGAKKYLRKQTPEGFVAHIEQLVASRPNPIRRIFIIDEVLWFDRAWLHEFLGLYKERVGIPFSMNFKFNGGVQEEDIALMAEAGAVAVCVATETGDEERRRGMLNKPVSDEHILKVAGWMNHHGIAFGSSAFFGLPGQTFEGHLAELDFYRKVNPKYLFTTFFQPYPGINLTEAFEVAAAMPAGSTYHPTIHHDMYLNLPDRVRLVNLKNVYFYMWKFPWMTKPLAFLCRFKVPWLFKGMALGHFAYYALWAEGISVRQFLIHIKNFAFNPILRRKQPPQSQGRPFDIGYGPDTDGPPSPTGGTTVQLGLPKRQDVAPVGSPTA